MIATAFPFAPESFHLILIATCLLTEFLDGYIARLYHWTSYFGQVLDPIADKLIGNLAYLTPLATLTAVIGLAATGQYAYLLRKSLCSAEQA